MGTEEYTTEQLEQLSGLYSEHIEDSRLEIVKIDKEFKKNNQKLITSAVGNVLGISMIAGILLNSNGSIMNLGTDQVSALIEEINNFLVPLMDKIDPLDLMSSTYMQLIGALEQIIDKFGIIGIGLASKAFTFITGTIKKGIKSKQLKDEKEVLEQKIKEYEDLTQGKGR